MVTFTRLLSGSSAIVISPLKSVKRPLVLATTRWRTVNCAAECDASMLNVPTSGMSRPLKLRLVTWGAVAVMVGFSSSSCLCKQLYLKIVAYASTSSYNLVVDPVLHDERITSLGLFLEAHDAVRRALDAGGAAPANFEILLRLARSEGQRLRMADLAGQTGLTPSGLSRAVDRLVADGLVERASCPTDARGFYAQLTPKGN